MGVCWDRKPCLRVTQQAGQATVMLCCREVMGTFWACAQPARDTPGQNVERGAEMAGPGVKGKTISGPGMKSKREDSLAEEKDK